MGEPVLIALGVHPDAQGDIVCDTVWVDPGLPPGVYAMMATDGTHAADLLLPDDLADRYGGDWHRGLPITPTPGSTEAHDGR